MVFGNYSDYQFFTISLIFVNSFLSNRIISHENHVFILLCIVRLLRKRTRIAVCEISFHHHFPLWNVSTTVRSLCLLMKRVVLHYHFPALFLLNVEQLSSAQLSLFSSMAISADSIRNCKGKRIPTTSSTPPSMP